MWKEVERMKGKLIEIMGVLLLAILATPAIAATVYIEPNKTAVAPGEQFAVNVSVKDGTANAVVAEFAFDTSKVTYVSSSSTPPFSVNVRVSGNVVSIVGISLTPVDISTKTRLATVVFRVNQGATGTIAFQCINAKVDGNNVSCKAGKIEVKTFPWQSYDKDGDGAINTLELINAIQDWLNGQLETVDLINVIQKWLQG